MPVTPDELRSALAAFRAGAPARALDTGRYRMRYFVWGAGPPLVFVHGMADAAVAFAMVAHRLADRFTCVGYELPDGVADGSALGRYRLPDYVADLLALLDHLRSGRAAVVGSSFGSLAALAALAAAPDRFTRGVLQGGFARRPLAAPEVRLAQLARFWPGWFGDWPAVRRVAMARLDRPAFATAPPEVYRFFLRNHDRTPIRAAALRGLTIARTDLRPLLPAVRAPVLLIGGDRDALVPPSCAAELERGLPDVRRVEFAGCGHYPQYTHPAEMAAAVRDFVPV